MASLMETHNSARSGFNKGYFSEKDKADGTSEAYLSSAGQVSGAGPMLSAIRFTRSGAVEAPA